jgi:hypothetical protein
MEKENKKSPMFQSLIKIQRELQTIAKNKKAFKGSYATIERVWESIRNIINDNGFVVIHKSEVVGDRNGLLTEALHESGDSIKSFIAYSDNHDPQERGKEITYYRRYNLNSIFNIIVEGEDNDATKPIGKYNKDDKSGQLAAEKLMNAESSEKAREIYKTLSPAERKTAEVIEAIKFIKDNQVK